MKPDGRSPYNGKPIWQWGSLIFGAIFFAWALFNLSFVRDVVKTALSVLFPFILGSFQALILNIPSSYMEERLCRNKKLGPHKALVRVIALVVSLIAIILIVVMIAILIVPQLVKVAGMLIKNLPYYREHLKGLLERFGATGINIDLDSILKALNVDTIRDKLLVRLPGLLSSFIGGAQSFLGMLVNIFVSTVFSFYLVTGKEKIKERTRLFMYTYFEKYAATIVRVGRLSVTQFQNFISAQCIEATILGCLCTIGLWIMKMPYALTIGVLVGVMALLPIVGTFFSACIGAILIVAVDPMKALVFIVFFLVLQQVENNIIYPRVVGDRVGLPGMWVLVAIMVGGGLFGIAGMFLAVPAGSVIYILINERMEKKRNSANGDL